jgi:outer membrane protein OmpA-like peptidoglycan-associated protein
LTGSVLAAALCACSAGPTRQLADARRAYDEAEDSPAAERHPNDLARAKVALDRAEAAHDDDPGSNREIQLAERAEYRAKLVTDRSNPDAVRARRVGNDDVAEVQRDGTVIRRDGTVVRRDGTVVREDGTVVRDRTAAENEADRAQHRDVRDDRAVAAKREKAADKKADSALQNLGSVANVKQEPRGVVITLSGSLLFPSGDRELSPVARQNLDQVAHALAQQPSTTTFQVEGYTDDSGSPQQNEQLASQRAKAVADHLVQSGIDANRIKVVSHGEHDPIANNDTAEGRAANRRVEIVVSEEG